MHTVRACGEYRRHAPTHSSQPGCSPHSSLGAREAGEVPSLSPGPHGSPQRTSPAQVLSDGLSKTLAATDTKNMHKGNIRHCAKCLTHPTAPTCYFPPQGHGNRSPEQKGSRPPRRASRWEGRAAGGKAERQTGTRDTAPRTDPPTAPAWGPLNLAAPSTHGQGGTAGTMPSSILPLLCRGRAEQGPAQDSPGSCMLSHELLVGEAPKGQPCSYGKRVGRNSPFQPFSPDGMA